MKTLGDRQEQSSPFFLRFTRGCLHSIQNLLADRAATFLCLMNRGELHPARNRRLGTKAEEQLNHLQTSAFCRTLESGIANPLLLMHIRVRTGTEQRSRADKVVILGSDHQTCPRDVVKTVENAVTWC